MIRFFCDGTVEIGSARRFLLRSTALVCGAAGLIGAAPDAPPATPTKAGVEEVVVTARRREEKLEHVPAAISVLGAKQLAERNVVTQSDLQTNVPGLTLRETQGSNSLTYSLRGQTIDNFTGSATAVVPYFDEVQLFTGGANTFFDLQSIQVLKGPQGTLFGRNATGGAVLFTTAQPKDDLDGYLTVRTGSYSLREVLGAVNVPIVSDKALLRVAFDLVDRDGYQKNLYNGEELGVVDRQSVRASLLLRPTDDLQDTLVVEADHAGGNSTANRLYAVNPCGATNGGFALNCTAALLFSPLADTVYGPGTWAAYLKAHPGLNPGGILAYFQQNAPKLGFWDADEASPVFHKEWDYRLVNTTTYDLTSDVQLKNIFGVSSTSTRDEGSSNGSPYLVFTSENLNTGEYGNNTDQFAYSEEFQVQGKALNQALTYIAGAYYQNSDANTLYPQVYFDLAPLGPPSSVDNAFEIFDRTEAIYAQGTYNFAGIGLDRLNFTGGYRYSWEQFTMDQRAESVFGPADQSVNFSNPSWTLGMSYQLTNDLLLYVEGRRSWRSGGLNGTAPPVTVSAAGGGNLFQPEYTRDVEVGAKFAGLVAGLPAHLNVAAYNQWIDNVQRAEFPVPPGRQQSIAVTINVPAAEVTGLEVDAAIRPFRWLDLGVAGALTDARFVQGQNSALIFGQLFVFNPYADTPRASGSAYATVTLPTPDRWGVMDLHGDIYGQTSMFFSNNNSTITPGTKLPGYGLVNLRYDWRNIYGSRFSFAAYVKNLLDKQYYAGGFALGASLGIDTAAIGLPQMAGVELTYRF